MKLEDVLPALREGKQVRRKGWELPQSHSEHLQICYAWESVTANDWEIVPEPVRVADYLVLRPREFQYQKDGILFYRDAWFKETHPIGSQPPGSVNVPESERNL